jgi:hypothetical protein
MSTLISNWLLVMAIYMPCSEVLHPPKPACSHMRWLKFLRTGEVLAMIHSGASPHLQYQEAIMIIKNRNSVNAHPEKYSPEETVRNLCKHPGNRAIRGSILHVNNPHIGLHGSPRCQEVHVGKRGTFEVPVLTSGHMHWG